MDNNPEILRNGLLRAVSPPRGRLIPKEVKNGPSPNSPQQWKIRRKRTNSTLPTLLPLSALGKHFKRRKPAGT